MPYSGIQRGTEGVDPVRVTISVTGEAPVACSASLAHWYSQDLGSIGPDATLVVTLWHDPITGETSLLNASEDRMPVEAIWCGVADRFRDTRTRLPLAFEAGKTAPQLGYVCSPAPAGRMSCVEG